MSYIRLTEQRRYFDGKSNIYAYPTSGSGDITFTGHLTGTIESEDFWELVLRAVERADLDEETFLDIEAAIKDQYEEEKQRTADLREVEDE